MNFTWILGLVILAILGYIGWAYYQKRKADKGASQKQPPTF